MAFKYAHLADLHLGSWRDPLLRKVSSKVFNMAIDDCVSKGVDFILFAGDIFNNAIPAIDVINMVASKLYELKSKGIPLYVIPGSHDFSPTNRSMVDVLESCGLLINVCKGNVNKETKKLQLKYVVDEKTGAKITGIIGRRGMLDKVYYENLDRESLEQENGYKIFMFHTTLTELKPKHLDMLDSQPASFLPKKHNYYAGGHLHHRGRVDIEDYGPITYTGALFPNNFAELEKYSFGGYYIIEVDGVAGVSNCEQKVEFVPIICKEHLALKLSCKNKTPKLVEEEILRHFKDLEVYEKIITIRVEGILAEGKSGDINWAEIFRQLMDKGAYQILKNTIRVVGQDYSEVLQGKLLDSEPEKIEEGIINDHLGQFQTFEKVVEKDLILSILEVLNSSKKEGEKVFDFNKRMLENMDVLFGKSVGKE